MGATTAVILMEVSGAFIPMEATTEDILMGATTMVTEDTADLDTDMGDMGMGVG